MVLSRKINDWSCLWRALIGSLGFGVLMYSYKDRPVEFLVQSINHSSLMFALIIFDTVSYVTCTSGWGWLAPRFASASASSFPLIPWWPGLISWMHPRGFLVVRESENCVGDKKIVSCTGLEKKRAIVIRRSNALCAKDAGPGLVILANSGIEIAKNEEFVLFRHWRNGRIEIFIKFFFDFIGVCHCRGIGTNKSGKFFALEGKSEGHQTIIDALWWLVKLADKRWQNGKANSRFSFLFCLTPRPEKGIPCFSLSKVTLICKARFTEGNYGKVIPFELTSNESSSSLWSVCLFPIKKAPTVIEVTLALVIFVFRPQKGDSCQPQFAGQDVLGQSFFRSPFPDPSSDSGEQRNPEKSCSVAQGRTRRTVQPSYRSNGHLPKGRLREGRC